MKDIFVVQDDITKQIITAMQVKLTQGEQVRLWARTTDNIEAYLKFLQQRQYHIRANRDDNLITQMLLKEAIALDPDFALAYVGLGFTYLQEIELGASEPPEEYIARAFEMAQKALSLDDSLGFAHLLLSSIYDFSRDFDRAIAEGERAIALDPNGADARAGLGRRLYLAGRYEEARALIKEAIRLNPFPPGYYFHYLGIACLMADRYEEAIEASKRTIDLHPGWLGTRLNLTAAYILSGREEEARAEAAELIRINPKFSLEEYAKRTYAAFKEQADVERHLEALRKAGLK